MEEQRGLILRLPEQVRQDVKGYRAQLERFQRGEISALAFRAIRVPMGVYEHRQEGHYMVRVRLGAGLVLPEQLRRLAELSRAHGNGVLHFTTRQDIQIHDVSLADTATVQEQLLEAGLSARGGGGNSVRNITSCPRSLVCPKAVFDVAPYAIAAAEYLLQSKSSFNLPRKFKTAFSGCGSDCALASVNDAGFFAHVQDGRKGFAVYAGGGLGSHAAAGVLVEEFIGAEEVFEVLEALKRLFDRLGDRLNKHAARLRYVVKRLGAEGFVAEYRKERAAVRQEGLAGQVPAIRDLAALHLPGYADSGGGFRGHDPISGCLEIGIVSPESAGSLEIGSCPRNPPGALSEKLPGRFTLHLLLPNGCIPAGDLARIGEIAERFGLGLVLATQQQDLLIPGVSGARIAPAQDALKSLSIDVLQPRPQVVACAGASTCKLGLCLSPRLAEELAGRFQAAGLNGKALSAAIRISGCPNSCGDHSIAAIGLEGKAKRHQGRLMPCYEILAGGKPGEGNARFAQRLGTVPAKAVPGLLVEALTRGLTGAEDLRKLVAARAEIPADAPDDYYVDFGADKPFSLAGRGPGECGAGVLDVVKVDIEEAAEALQSAAGAGQSAAIHRAIVAAARALLPVFGVEGRKDREVFEAFRERLVAAGWVRPDTQELLAAALDWRLGDRPSLEDLAARTKQLVERVRELFGSLDASLHFKAQPYAASAGVPSGLPAASPRCKSVDLRGVSCPVNFVQAKIALEQLKVGEDLEILLDCGQSVRNVPASFADQGQEVLSVSTVGDHFRVCVRRSK
ncbi:MAG: sulfurtransferase TusA family protein [Planctomycetota bacterium]